MSDQEIICTFMEPDERPNVWAMGQSKRGWWYYPNQSVGWQACTLGLDALWEVEERLTEEQWPMYYRECVDQGSGQLIHLSAKQKIKALAAVLRPIMETR